MNRLIAMGLLLLGLAAGVPTLAEGSSDVTYVNGTAVGMREGAAKAQPDSWIRRQPRN